MTRPIGPPVFLPHRVEKKKKEKRCIVARVNSGARVSEARLKNPLGREKRVITRALYIGETLVVNRLAYFSPIRRR